MRKKPKTKKMGRGRAAVLLLGFISITLGTWQLGGGVYIMAKAAIGQTMLENAWQAALDGEAEPKPWSWADVSPVARLQVPRLGIDMIVLNDVSGEAMAWGPGHMPGTPAPGKPGLSVLGGHRDTHFTFLKNVQSGDEIIITGRDGTRHTFTVTAQQIEDAFAHGLSFDSGPSRLALITCWPFDALTTGGSERYIVTAEVVD